LGSFSFNVAGNSQHSSDLLSVTGGDPDHIVTAGAPVLSLLLLMHTVPDTRGGCSSVSRAPVVNSLVVEFVAKVFIALNLRYTFSN